HGAPASHRAIRFMIRHSIADSPGRRASWVGAKALTRLRRKKLVRYPFPGARFRKGQSPPPSSILGDGLPREPLLRGALRSAERQAPGEERPTRDSGDPGHVEVGHAAPLEQDGYEPPDDLQSLGDGH